MKLLRIVLVVMVFFRVKAIIHGFGGFRTRPPADFHTDTRDPPGPRRRTSNAFKRALPTTLPTPHTGTYLLGVVKTNMTIRPELSSMLDTSDPLLGPLVLPYPGRYLQLLHHEFLPPA